MESLRQAVVLSPDNVPLLILWGQACLDEFSPEEASEAYQRILKLDPSHIEAKLGLSKSLFMLGKISEALIRTEALLVQEPRFAAGRLFLARLLASEGNRDQALAAYEEARRCGAPPDAGLEREFGLKAHPQKPETADPMPQHSEEKPPDEFCRPAIDFSAVGGMEALKEEIRMKILHPMKNPDLFKAYGKKAGGGVLFYGPPGCGKTLLSRATAGEMGSSFISVGIHQILDMWLGNSEKNLHQLFQLARSRRPCALFFDEIDALAADRADLRKSAGRNVINQFLAEMDGTGGDNEGLLLLGATNAPWHIDPAFRRPGRFDRILFVPPPDEAARAAIIEVMAKDKPVTDLDVRALARKTKDFSGADLRAVFDQATERCLALAMKEGRLIPLTTKLLLEAAAEHRPTTREWFENAKNYALYANQGGLYNELLSFLGITK